MLVSRVSFCYQTYPALFSYDKKALYLWIIMDFSHLSKSEARYTASVAGQSLHWKSMGVTFAA